MSAPPSRRTPAGLRVADEITRAGAITFARFMEIVLYDPQVGYYAHWWAGPGTEGDYVTSPETHPAFGELICSQIEEMWRALDEPDPFWLVEGGPGSGALAAGILRTAEARFPAFGSALRLALIEASPVLRERQADTLAPWQDRIEWLDASTVGERPRNVPASWPRPDTVPLPQGEGVPPFIAAGCVLANELLDALPTHRVVMRPDGLRELYVGLVDGRIALIEGEPSSPLLESQIAAGGGALADGQRGEVSLAAPAWTRWAARLIERGYLLFIDYGEPSDTLYGAEHPGTLRCYDRHTLNRNALRRIGLQDITADVDFSAVVRSAEAEGCLLLGATHQASFLERLGIDRYHALVDQEIADRAVQHAQHSRLRGLVDPGGLGRLMTVVLGRERTEPSTRGFLS